MRSWHLKPAMLFLLMLFACLVPAFAYAEDAGYVDMGGEVVAEESDASPLVTQDDGEQAFASEDLGVEAEAEAKAPEMVTTDDSSELPSEEEACVVTPTSNEDSVSEALEESQAPELSVQTEDVAQTVTVNYATHVQRLGWLAPSSNGSASGTSGRSLRLESFWVSLGDMPMAGGVSYRAQVQREGWLGWTSDGDSCGTTGKGLRMEAIQIVLYGDLADSYDVYYRVHTQGFGWMAWAKNGELAGSTGKSLRLEAMQVVLVKKGAQAPAASPANTFDAPFVDGTRLVATAHVQSKGWLKSVGSGKVVGTTGKGLRLEALSVALSGARVPGGVEGQAHVQGIGWQRVAGNGGTVGTMGQSRRIEAIRYWLTGEAAEVWDIYYRAHVQGVGWLWWAKNGEEAGTTGLSARIEAVQFVLVEKGGEAPREEFLFEGPFELSGDKLIDSYVWRTVITNGWEGESGLRAAFDHVCAFPFKRSSNWPGPDWQSWSVTFAKQMLVWHGGNCHRYASLMHWFAKALGYESRCVPGKLRGANGSDHGWLEVDIDGVTYVVDPAVQNAYPEYNWYLVRYEEAKLKYYDLDGNRILK